MAEPMVTIRIRFPQAELDRIEAEGRRLDLSPAGFVQYAIENELARLEAAHLEEQAALDALGAAVLSGGQAARIVTDVEPGSMANCQLCLREIPQAAPVEGPLLCDACYTLAQGSRAP